MITATIKLVLTGKILSNGKQVVFLRITKDRRKKHIGLGLQCKEEHFVNECFTRKHPNQNVENELLLRFKQRALEILRDFQVNEQNFTLIEFEKKFRGTEDENQCTVLDFFNEIIKEKEKAGKVSSANIIRETSKSLFKYAKKNLKFEGISSTFLEKYEIYLKANGCKNGGVAFRMRELRTIVNKARKRGITNKQQPYPFENYCISKLKSKPRKIALSLEDFRKFKNIDLSMHPHLEDTHNYFLFSIYARGMNFHDMALLRWSDIRDGRVFYVRSKTKGSLNFEIIEPAQKILDYYRAQKRPTEYVFPVFLRENMTPKQIEYRKLKILKRYNKELKEIATLAGIDKKMSSYVARHSFATILKMSGTPIEKISEMMGHKDVSITIAYLKDFSDEELDKENRKFLDF